MLPGIALALAACGDLDDGAPQEEQTLERRAALFSPTSNCERAAYTDAAQCYANICYALIEDAPCPPCDASYQQAVSDCRKGFMTIYRGLYSAANYPYSLLVYHKETSSLAEVTETSGKMAPGRGLEGVFRFAATPRPGQPAIYRCRAHIAPKGCSDFLSHDWACEGQLLLGGCETCKPYWLAHGYSFAPGEPNVKPVYRCRIGLDHFISWSPTCEGQTVDGFLGHAVPGS
jgi:hypothetical protein